MWFEPPVCLYGRPRPLTKAFALCPTLMSRDYANRTGGGRPPFHPVEVSRVFRSASERPARK
jgi:hypothetical protein